MPLTGLVLNLCPALMNEAAAALRYEVPRGSDETLSQCGCSGSSGGGGRGEVHGRRLPGVPGRPVSDEVMVHHAGEGVWGGPTERTGH